MSTIQKRQARAALISEARAIIDTAEAANRNLTADEQTAYEGKLAQAEEMKTRIEREERQLALDAENAKPINGNAPVPSGVSVRSNERPKGQGFTNAVRAIGVGGRDRRLAAQFAEETLHDPELARALSAGSATGGGFAVPSALSEEFVEFLRPASVVRAAGARVLPMPNGNLSLPKITGGASATYIGENTNIGATQQTLGQVKLMVKKLAAIVPISNDLIRYANPNTDGVIREDLVAAVAQAEDLSFLRGDGTAYTPKGMKNWALAASTFNASGTVDITHITSDLGTAISNLLTANVKVTLETGAWFFSPRTFVYLKTLRNPTTGQYAFPEMQGTDPRLLGYKVKYTSQIPTNLTATPSGGSQITTASEGYFANMADMVIGEGANLVLDVSSEASYVDAGGNTVSAFAQDQTVIRVIEENDFGARYEQAISVISAISY
jgi:HK97 family phage major capsid protein